MSDCNAIAHPECMKTPSMEIEMDLSDDITNLIAVSGRGRFVPSHLAIEVAQIAQRYRAALHRIGGGDYPREGQHNGEHVCQWCGVYGWNDIDRERIDATPDTHEPTCPWYIASEALVWPPRPRTPNNAELWAKVDALKAEMAAQTETPHD